MIIRYWNFDLNFLITEYFPVLLSKQLMDAKVYFTLTLIKGKQYATANPTQLRLASEYPR